MGDGFAGHTKSMQSHNYTMKSTTKYTKRKQRSTILMQSIDNLTENIELNM